MPLYRVYCLDSAGKIEATHEIEAKSDDAALEEAESVTNNARCEVWQRDRFVGRVVPQRSTTLS